MTTRTAYLKQVKGNSFVGKSNSNHWVSMDVGEEFGGNDAACTPKELLLLSLAGCTSSDVVSILQKKRVNFSDFEVNISADLCGDHPKVYTRIDLEYVVYGDDINPKDVERAIELSQTKYCGVTAMLKNTVEINHSYRIETTKEIAPAIV
ncbi:MAG: OsmC family protein [Ignavibacteriaceae bacterium]